MSHSSRAWTLLVAFLLLLPVGASAGSLTSMTVKPTDVVGGASSVGTVTLDAAAPAGGAWVVLTNHAPAVATVPGVVTVLEGETSAFFHIATGAVSSMSSVTVDAMYAGVTRTATVTVTPREPVRGVEGDLWADVILGKPDYTEITPNEVVPFKVNNPAGVFVDRSVSPGRAYVWDSGNSRILGIDLATCYAGASPCTPQVVIGQPSGSDHSACNGDSGFQHYPTRAPASAGSLCGMPEVTLSPLEWKSYATMAGDAQGNLYVPDAFNNRVLKYVSPFTTDGVADEVWGQTGFTGNLCNQGASAPTASTLCFTVTTFSAGGVALDAAGNLWVADNRNNRVLRFPKDPGSGIIAKTADLVLGQPNFVSDDNGMDLSRMWGPSSLRFGPDGRLYVADTNNDRVLLFTPNPSFVTGMAASLFGSQFAAPYGMETDSDGLWINDTSNSMLELWDWNGTTVQKVLGKDTYQPDRHCVQWLCYSGGGIGVDAAGNVLPSVFVYVQDVLRFAAPIPAPQAGVFYQPDRRLFYPPEGYNFRGSKGLRSGAGVAIHGDQLLVADAGRVVFWNGLATLTNGKPFDGYAGSTVFNFQFNCCGYLKADSSNRLWVQGFTEGIHVYQLPLTHQQAKIATILTPGSTVPVLGGGSLTLNPSYIGGLVPSPDGGALWVSDTYNHRVLRIRNPLTAPIVDVVLGQTDTVGNLCNRGLVPPPGTGTTLVADATMLCHPGALSFDRQGNLFVSDHGPEVEGNWRLLRFAGTLFPANNAIPLFAVAATKLFPYRSGQPGITFEPAFDSFNRMVVGYNSYLGGNFVGVYNDPAGPSTDPDKYLNDFSSWPSAIAFDANDNLYVGDANRARLLIYRKPVLCLPPDAPLASSNGPICAGETLQLTASTIAGATYAWTGPNGFTSSLQNPSIPVATAAASGTYSVTASLGVCTTSAGMTFVTVVTPPSATITAPASVAARSEGNVASVPNAGAGATYAWTVSNGTITGGLGSRAITFTAGIVSPVNLGVTVGTGVCNPTGAASVSVVLPNRVFASARTGNDANNCASILTPCQTLAGAAASVAAGGEVIVLDSGGYGPVTVTRAVTIEAPAGVLAFIHPPSGEAVTINAGASDKVVLRGLTLNGGATSGVAANTVGALYVENCVISGFATGLAMTGEGQLFVKDTVVRGNSVAGISLAVPSGAAAASIDRTRLESNGVGLMTGNGSKASIRRSVASGNGSGVVADGAGAELDADACLVANNAAAGIAAGPSGGTVRVSRSTVTGNAAGLQQSGSGVLLSRTDNTVEGNTADTVGTIGSYSPK